MTNFSMLCCRQEQSRNITYAEYCVDLSAVVLLKVNWEVTGDQARGVHGCG